MAMSRKLVPPEDLRSYGFTIGNKQRARLEAAGKFPKRVHPTAYTHAYVEDELLAHAEAVIRRRDAALSAA
jgi:hypothetical protein